MLHEAAGSAPIRLSPNTIAAAAASAPPAETPTSAGSASGLRNRPCMMAPRCREQGADHGGHGDARQPDRPQHQLVARERRIAGVAPSPSAAGSRASGMPAAPIVSAISAAPASAISRQSEGQRRRAGATRARCGAWHVPRCRRGPSQPAICGERRRREFLGLRRQRRIELDREIARGGRGARPEAEQIEAFHRDEGLVGRGRRQRERRMRRTPPRRPPSPCRAASTARRRAWRR